MIWMFLISFLIRPVGAADLEAIYLNNKALSEFGAKNNRQGYNELLKALEKDPLNPVLQYNLGVAFMINEELDKALQQFEAAEKYAKDPELLFQIHFAAGVAATNQKNIDLALRHYQGALEHKSESVEVKTNIELLWQGSKGGEGDGQGNPQDNKDGKGKGDQDKDQESEGQGEKDKEKGNRDGPVQQPKPQPQPFKSKELTQDQVRKILEELKNQEQKIRATEQDKGAKDNGKAKDW